MSICRSLVAGMKGRIWLETEEDVGNFFFEIPLRIGAPGTAQLCSSGPSKARPTLLDQSILVAEDNIVNQRLIGRVLESRAHSVVICETGTQVLQTWHGARFDLVLMDVQMPGLDGIETTRRIRSEEALTGEHVPIVAMTACAMVGDRERCLEAGFDDFLAKPLRFPELDRVLTGLAAAKTAGDYRVARNPVRNGL